MSRKFDRKAMRDELVKRTQESEERKEGESFQKYFKSSAEVTLAKFGPTKDEPHIIDIIPFIAGDKMPDFMRVKEGKPAYYLDIYVHQNIGPGKAWVVCPAKNYGKPCPICSYINELEREGKEYDDFAEIAPKRRCVYNIVNQSSTKEAKRGIQIWECSHKYSEKPIQNAAKNPRGGGSIAFSHPDKEVGQSISFSVDNDTYKTISGHKLVPRDYDIDDEILEQAYQLDQIIEVLSEKEIQKIFDPNAADTSSDEPTELVDKKKDDVEDVKNYEPEPPEADETKHSKRRQERKNEVECPDGGVFGEDIDQLKYCEKCEMYDNCANKADEIEEKKREEKRKARESEGPRRRI
jgi:hypothetical protein